MDDDMILTHHGVRGQKWGVRRAEKRAAKADSKWEQGIFSIHGAIAVHNEVADRMNSGGIAALNARHPKAHLDHDTPETRAYLKDYEDPSNRFTAAAITKIHGTSPSGLKKAKLGFLPDGNPYIKLVSTEIAHSDITHADTRLDVVLMFKTNSNGLIISSETKQDVLIQSNISDDDMILTHHGVKGQKWGVRRPKAQLTGGSEEHVRTVATRTQAKTSGTHTLTNAQMRSAVERMNLEQQFNTLNASKSQKRIKAGVKFVSGVGKQQAGGLATKAVTKSAGKAFTAARIGLKMTG